MSRRLSARDGESPLFNKYQEFMNWLVARVEVFPRSQRFLLGNRLLDGSFGCHAQLIRARKVTGTARATALLEADIQIETLRLQLRLALEQHCLSIGQYEQGARLLNEIGKLVGTWRYATT